MARPVRTEDVHRLGLGARQMRVGDGENAHAGSLPGAAQRAERRRPAPCLARLERLDAHHVGSGRQVGEGTVEVGVDPARGDLRPRPEHEGTFGGTRMWEVWPGRAKPSLANTRARGPERWIPGEHVEVDAPRTPALSTLTTERALDGEHRRQGAIGPPPRSRGTPQRDGVAVRGLPCGTAHGGGAPRRRNGDHVAQARQSLGGRDHGRQRIAQVGAERDVRDRAVVGRDLSGRARPRRRRPPPRPVAARAACGPARRATRRAARARGRRAPADAPAIR